MINDIELKKKFIASLPLVALTENPDYTDCWPWMGGSNADNTFYGSLYHKKVTYRAHILSYLFFNGSIPDGMLIRHTCDNPICVNPKHLILGTHSDNTLDALKRDRLPNHSLNEEAVKVIKWMLKYQNYYGLSNKLASFYKVNRKAIYKIKAGITWQHVKV